eukprot:Selendium_serpulae@DN6288_c0_g2_i12.p1
MKRLYKFVVHVPEALKQIEKVMKDEIVNSGCQLLENMTCKQTFVDGLVEKKKNYDRFVSDSFENNDVFVDTVMSGMQMFTIENPRVGSLESNILGRLKSG